MKDKWQLNDVPATRLRPPHGDEEPAEVDACVV